MSQLNSENKAQLWRERISQQSSSSMSIAQWCQQHQVSRSSFQYWKTRLSKPSLTRSCFTELAPPEMPAVSIEYHSMRIYIGQIFDAKIFKSCVKALRELSC